MPRVRDLEGQRRGMLTIGKRVPSPQAHAVWSCICDCGNWTEIASNNLRKQHSCGCTNLGRRTHNMSDTPTYLSWIDMRRRCNDPENVGYANYGARGIAVCDRWQNSFENFLSDMGERPKGHSIERRNNNDGYHPANCCWLPKNKQSLNRRGNVYVEVDGESITAAEAARKLGVKYTTFLYRLNAGRAVAGMQRARP